MNDTMDDAAHEDSMIGASAQRLFSDHVDHTLIESVERGAFANSLWTLTTDNGFTHALCAEAAGGIGATWDEAWPLLRAIGYWQVPLPLAETMIATLLLSAARADLPIGPIALVDETASSECNAAHTRVSGRFDNIAWARHCRTALIGRPDGRLLLVDLTPSGARQSSVVIEPKSNHAGLAADTVRLADATIIDRIENPFAALAQPLRHLGALVRSAMMVGALERLLDESVRYANDRVQFGKPIGKYQAIQQSLAVLAGDVTSARVAALVAAMDSPSLASPDCKAGAFSIAVAKVRCGEAATRATSIAHQVHGAIGFTREHSLHFATRRLWAWRTEFGTDSWWAERLGRAAIAAGSDGFWPSLTNRNFAPSPDTTDTTR